MDNFRRSLVAGLSVLSAGAVAGTFSGATNGTAPGPVCLDVRRFGAIGDGSADDAPAIQRAIDEAERSGLPVLLPPGRFLARSGLVVRNTVAIMGAGVRASALVPAPGFTGFVITIDDCWRENSVPGGEGLMQPAIDLSVVRSGVKLQDFAIIGDRSQPGIASGIRTFDRVDQLEIRSVDILSLPGEGLSLGKHGTNGNNRALIRESFFENVYVRHCGSSGTHPPFTLSTGPSAGDGSNQVYFYGLRLVENFAAARIDSQNGLHPTRRIRIFGMMLHGRNQAPDAPADDLLRIVGLVEDVRVYGLATNGSHRVAGQQFGTIRLEADQRGAAPAGLFFDGDTRACQGHGYILESARAVRISGTAQTASIAGVELLVTGEPDDISEVVYDVLLPGSIRRIGIRNAAGTAPGLVVFSGGSPIPRGAP